MRARKTRKRKNEKTFNNKHCESRYLLILEELQITLGLGRVNEKSLIDQLFCYFSTFKNDLLV